MKRRDFLKSSILTLATIQLLPIIREIENPAIQIIGDDIHIYKKVNLRGLKHKIIRRKIIIHPGGELVLNNCGSLFFEHIEGVL